MTEGTKKTLKALGIAMLIVGIVGVLVFARTYSMAKTNREEALLRAGTSSSTYGLSSNLRSSLANKEKMENSQTGMIACGVVGAAGLIVTIVACKKETYKSSL